MGCRAVHRTPCATRGSRKWLQMLVNCCPELLDEQLRRKLNSSSGRIDWLSPLRSDDFAEYYDQCFLDKLGVCLSKRPLKEFWPQSGPRWDGLGVADGGQRFLVEAKSHIRELRSVMSAKSDSSASRILYSLAEAKKYLGVSARVDWTRPFYQHANRLAHLYLIHVLNEVDAYLVNVYFSNDEDMKGPGTIVPRTAKEWKAAILMEEMALGLPTEHLLSNRVLSIFIDVKEIKRKAVALVTGPRAPNRRERSAHMVGPNPQPI